MQQVVMRNAADLATHASVIQKPAELCELRAVRRVTLAMRGTGNAIIAHSRGVESSACADSAKRGGTSARIFHLLRARAPRFGSVEFRAVSAGDADAYLATRVPRARIRLRNTVGGAVDSCADVVTANRAPAVVYQWLEVTATRGGCGPVWQ
ncbi:hypothetical protein B0H10DRAFT_2216892 [Mycena sp. CBHHK59/15]|nr:hypothetical protein B0H10DRAFT_2216892 [Mycena sp. CBHHK59/15]